MVEFFIIKVPGGYSIEADDVVVAGSFASREAAADMAVRFAQDTGAPAYRIFY